MNLSQLKLYRVLSPAAKAAIWFTVCNFLIKGLSFFTGPLFTRLLPETEYGKLSIFASYEQLVIIFATWELYSGAYQRGLFKYKDYTSLFTESILVLTTFLTAVIFGILFAFRHTVYEITGISNQNLFLLFLFILFSPGYHCWLIRMRTKFRYQYAVPLTVLYSLAGIIPPALALWLFVRTANMKYGATLIGHILLCAPFYFRSLHLKNISQNRTIFFQQLRFSLRYQGPLVLHSLSFLILGHADRVMIGQMSGMDKAAFYSVAYGLASSISIFQSSINEALIPWRIQKMEEKDYSSLRRTTTVLLISIAGIVLFFIAVAPEGMRLLFPENYYEAVFCIPPVAASMYFIFLYSIFVHVETYFEKTQYVLFAVLHYWFMRRTCTEMTGGTEIYSLREIAAVSAVLLIVTTLLALCYSLPILRRAMCTLLLFIAFLFRKRLMGLLMIFRQR